MSLIDTLLMESAPLRTPNGNAFFVALRTDGAAGTGTQDDPFNGSTVRGAAIPVVLTKIGTGGPVACGLIWIFSESQKRIVKVVQSSPDVASGECVRIVAPSGKEALNGRYWVREVIPPPIVPETEPRAGFTCDCDSDIDDPPDNSEEPTPGFFYDTTDLISAATSAPHGLSTGDLVEISGATGDGAPFFNWRFEITVTSPTTFTFTAQLSPFNPEGSIVCRRIVYGFDKVIPRLTENTTIFIGPGVFETRGPHPHYLKNTEFFRPGCRFYGSGMEVTTLKVVVANRITGREIHHSALGGRGYDDHRDRIELCDLTVDSNMADHPLTVQVGDTVRHGPYSRLVKAAGSCIGSHGRFRRIAAKDFGTQNFGSECFVLVGPSHHPSQPEFVNTVFDECVMLPGSVNSVREVTILGGAGGDWRGLTARNCVVEGGLRGPQGKIEKIESADGHDYRITTREPHFRAAGEHVLVQNIQVLDDGGWHPSRTLNGTFRIISIQDEHTLTYRVPLNPAELYDPENGNAPEPVFSSVTYHANVAIIGTDYHGVGVSAGYAGVARHNRIYGVRAGSYNDTGSTPDASFWMNYYSSVIGALAHGWDPANYGFDYPWPITALALSGDLATLTVGSGTYRPWLPGGGINITQAKDDAFNGFFEIENVFATNQFTFRLRQNVAGVPPFFDANTRVRASWRARYLDVDRNVIEVGRGQGSSAPISAVPHHAQGPIPIGAAVAFRRYAACENVIRSYLDIAYSQTKPPAGQDDHWMESLVGALSTVGAEQVLKQRNAIGLAGNDDEVLRIYSSERVSVNDNYRSNGVPVQAHDPERVFDDTPRRIEDALCLSLL